ncbi:MAG: hypothetical protein Q9167_002354 [Letrouitia subvulpina]
MSIISGWGAQVSTRELGARIMAKGEATKDMVIFRQAQYTRTLSNELISRIYDYSFESEFNVQLLFTHFRLVYDKPEISSYVFLRFDLKIRIQAFSDGDRKDPCTHLRNEPTVEEKKRFRSALAALDIEPLEKTQSAKQGRKWLQQIILLFGYLQGGQDADQSDDLVEEEAENISDDSSSEEDEWEGLSDVTIESGEEPMDETKD